jgi:hypothetical protein
MPTSFTIFLTKVLVSAVENFDSKLIIGTLNNLIKERNNDLTRANHAAIFLGNKYLLSAHYKIPRNFLLALNDVCPDCLPLVCELVGLGDDDLPPPEDDGFLNYLSFVLCDRLNDESIPMKARIIAALHNPTRDLLRNEKLLTPFIGMLNTTKNPIIRLIGKIVVEDHLGSQKVSDEQKKSRGTCEILRYLFINACIKDTNENAIQNSLTKLANVFSTRLQRANYHKESLATNILFVEIMGKVNEFSRIHNIDNENWINYYLAHQQKLREASISVVTRVTNALNALFDKRKAPKSDDMVELTYSCRLKSTH